MMLPIFFCTSQECTVSFLIKCSYCSCSIAQNMFVIIPLCYILLIVITAMLLAMAVHCCILSTLCRNKSDSISEVRLAWRCFVATKREHYCTDFVPNKQNKTLRCRYVVVFCWLDSKHISPISSFMADVVLYCVVILCHLDSNHLSSPLPTWCELCSLFLHRLGHSLFRLVFLCNNWSLVVGIVIKRKKNGDPITMAIFVEYGWRYRWAYRLCT